MATIGSMASHNTAGGVVVDPRVQLWLISLIAIVFAMIMVGGATRLTNSGLSITEWKPLVGAIPPLNAADWQEAFAKYKEIPQYKLMNKGMTLEAFKTIFWWEWAHRFLGRLIGLAFLVPFVFFQFRGALTSGLRNRLLAIFALGGLQGFIGWYMVKSGLVDRTDVSQYRLAVHLSVAVLIIGALLWVVCSLPRSGGRAINLATVSRGQRISAGIIAAAMFLQIALGALVAGMKAGLAHNTWPLMDGRLIPTGLGVMSPWWKNLFENALTVQFNHRVVAYGITTLVVWHGISIIRSADHPHIRTTAQLLLAATVAQVVLGIWTLLTSVPISLGLAHQAGAVILFATAVVHAHSVLHRTDKG
jgi:heme a synthase